MVVDAGVSALLDRCGLLQMVEEEIAEVAAVEGEFGGLAGIVVAKRCHHSDCRESAPAGYPFLKGENCSGKSKRRGTLCCSYR